MDGFSQSFAAVMPNVREVLLRFPVAALLSVVLTIYLLYGAAENVDVVMWAMGLLAMFFASVGASLFAERRSWGLMSGVVLSLLVSFIILALFYFGGEIALTPVMMPVAAVLGASSFAYLNLTPDNRSYWQFNHTYWFSLVIAGLGGLLIAALVALLIAAYGMLFDDQIKKAYQYSFIVSLFLVGPLFWLSILPRSLTEPVVEGEPVEFTSRVTALFVKYVFVPFFFLFAALLHGLAVKVLLEGALPSGQIGWYGLLLMIGGVGTYLMAYPTRRVSGPLVKFFVSYWMWFLLVPLLMVGAAHYLRVAHYGMTPMRFYLAGLFIWAAVLIAYGFYVKYFGRRGDEALALRGEFDLRLISVLAAFIIFISSFGPWGAEAVSTKWQKERLMAQLGELGLLNKGVISKSLPPRNDPANGRLVSDTRNTLAYFRDRERAEGLIDLLPGDARKELRAEMKAEGRFDGRRSRVYLALSEAITGRKTRAIEAPRVKSHTLRVKAPYNLKFIAGGKLHGPIYQPIHKPRVAQDVAQSSLPQNSQPTVVNGKTLADAEKTALVFALEDKEFVARQGAAVIGRFPMAALETYARRFDSIAKSSIEAEEVMVLKSATGEAKLYITSLSYSDKSDQDKGDAEFSITGLRFWLFLPE